MELEERIIDGLPKCICKTVSVTFNNEIQKNLGTLSSLTDGKITTLEQLKGIDVLTNTILMPYVSKNNVYAMFTDSTAYSGTFSIKLMFWY